MKLFLDTSTLFKLYHFEKDTEIILSAFKKYKIEAIFLSEITKIEFDSVVWKKCRKQEISAEKVKIVIKNFEKDWTYYHFVNDNKSLKKSARNLITKYGTKGLRTLDSIQLASAIAVKNIADLFLTSDTLLKDFFISENLPVKL